MTTDTLPLLYERDGPVATFILNRPAARNALTPELSSHVGSRVEGQVMRHLAVQGACPDHVLTGPLENVEVVKHSPVSTRSAKIVIATRHEEGRVRACSPGRKCCAPP